MIWPNSAEQMLNARMISNALLKHHVLNASSRRAGFEESLTWLLVTSVQDFTINEAPFV